jgi:branched-chain amino acid transport system ATP-binding protein
MKTEPILAARGLTRRFGGLLAVDAVDLELQQGRIHAVIGPNGAGKSTLVNLLSGELAPSSGTVVLRGEEITGWSADRIARHGVARSFQRTNIFFAFSAFENCRLAAQSRRPRFGNWFRSADRYRDLIDIAMAALADAGLEERSGSRADALSHGERRQLEIAMSLATAPDVLLLDEPMAGMGSDESARLIALLRKLAPDHAILLVEHDMDAVFALADRLTVMVNGIVLASDTPDAIRANAEVQRAYLGNELGNELGTELGNAVGSKAAQNNPVGWK